jgi:hypothetical protein
MDFKYYYKTRIPELVVQISPLVNVPSMSLPQSVSQLELLLAFVPSVQFGQGFGNFLPDLELFCLLLQEKVYPLYLQ